MKVTLLEKPIGKVWAPAQVNMLVEAGLEVERLGDMPHRICLPHPPTRRPLKDIIAGIDCTMRDVDYRDRWS
jgi:hypothetical protein